MDAPPPGEAAGAVNLRVCRLMVAERAIEDPADWTAYMRWGKGPKQRLQFTKTGDPKLEEAYATHFVWPGKGPFHPPSPKETPQ